MPIVHIELFPGRTDVQKEFIARRVIDALAEIAGCTREGVHVIFDEVQPASWAIGPRLTSARPRSRPSDPGYLVVSTIKCKPGKRDEYLAWRRDSVYPFMARSEGFVSSMLIANDTEERRYVIINKWSGPEAEQRYLQDPREAELRREATALLDELATTRYSGPALDVFGAPT
jgi:4-oxalocrotonate tautomerase